MTYVLKSRVGITTQVAPDFAVKLGKLAASLEISRHKLTVLALLAGLDIAVAQIRAEQAATAANQPCAAVKE